MPVSSTPLADFRVEDDLHRVHRFLDVSTKLLAVVLVINLTGHLFAPVAPLQWGIDLTFGTVIVLTHLMLRLGRLRTSAAVFIVGGWLCVTAHVVNGGAAGFYWGLYFSCIVMAGLLLSPWAAPAVAVISSACVAWIALSGDPVVAAQSGWPSKCAHLLACGVLVAIFGKGFEAAIRRIRRQNRRLAAEQARYFALFDQAPDGVLLLDERGVVRHANPVARKLLGGPEASQDPVGRPAADVVPLFHAASGSPGGLVCRLELEGGAERRVEVRASPLDAGQLRTQVVVRDVTEVAQLSERLRQSQKLDALGQLACGVAHDFNNVLTVVGLVTDSIDEDGKVDTETVADLQTATAHARALTRQLLDFGRSQPEKQELFSVGETLAGLERMLSRLLPRDVKLEVGPLEPGLAITCDSNRFAQLITNLVINARDAMPGGGTITVAATHENGKARIRVEDTGCGMSEEQQRKAFEPFFSTKAPGKGTGLGLATVRGIINAIGGAIEVHSEPGVGTRFELTLPNASIEAAAQA